ncbi:MAG: hypothetical protein FGM46_07875 [Ferruginibacter sp.]|nr:hypothetical protein [Ferruginibacter sp.]
MNLQHRYLITNAVILVFFCFSFLQLNAQQNKAGKKYRLLVMPLYKDSLFQIQDLKLINVFNSKTEALNYVSGIPSLLMQKGYPAASIDSLITSDTSVVAWLYSGPKVNHIELSFHQSADGLPDPDLNSKMKRMNQVGNLNQLEQLQQRIVSYYEERGYPFASVVLSLRSPFSSRDATTPEKSLLAFMRAIKPFKLLMPVCGDKMSVSAFTMNASLMLASEISPRKGLIVKRCPSINAK